MSDTNIRLVVFDAGGVIVRVNGPWAAAQALAGIPISERVNSAEFIAIELANAIQHQRGEISTADYLARTAPVAGLDPDEIQRVLDAWIGDEYPGWERVIERLERAGIATALLSNTNAHHWESMVPGGSRRGRYPAIGRLRHHFGSHLLGGMKPDPAVFHAVEDATGARGPDVLFFDDLPANVEGARQCGWRAVLIDPAGDPAQRVLDALREAGI